MSTKKLLVSALLIAAAITTGWPGKAYALQAPHVSPAVTSCNACHGKAALKTLSSFNILCFNSSYGCHWNSGSAAKKALSMQDASNRFGNIAQSPGNAKQSSHGWKIPNVNSDAGVTAQNNLNQPTDSRWTSKIYCTRCHRAMGGTGYSKFLRADPTGNYICFQCHAARRIDNVRDPLQSSDLHYSHPVEVNYSTARGKKPDFFNASPQLASGYDESARPRLYTTANASAGYNSSRLSGKNAGAVVCQSCHGPIHSADSNPYTLDNFSVYSKLGKYSTSQGNLLRQYPIRGPKASDNLCKACHNVVVHDTSYSLPSGFNFTCGTCHTPHKKAGEANRYLILENISTPYNGIRPIYFEYTTGMANRYGAPYTANSKQYYGGYSQNKARLDMNRPTSSAICQACHTKTKYQRNYSSPNHTRTGGGSSAHPSVYDTGTGKYRFCPVCHVHTAGFKPAGAAACGSCHFAPPYDNFSGGQSTQVIGRHAKHVKHMDGSNSNASYSWGDGRLSDDRSSTAYGFSCGRCHSPFKNYSDSQHKPATLNQGIYTADIGFNIGDNESLPKNPNAFYSRDTRWVKGDNGSNYTDNITWSVPDSGGNGTCFNLYCHGQWYNGYTSNNPKFTGSQPCGSCHGAKPNDPPGKTGGVNYGAHPRHVGNANNQQYGSSTTPNFRCNACHNLTVNSNVTTIDDRRYHVNGKVDIAFDQSGYYPGDANSNYNGFTYSNYTSRKPAMFTRPQYKTCGLIYCHSDGSRTQGNYSVPFNAGMGAGTAKYPNWSSSSYGTFTMTVNGQKRRCFRCHGNSTYKGITAAMPGYTSLRSGPSGKGNSHKKHVIVNGFMCNVCHSLTVNPDNKSIADTTKHVNRQYDIKILRAYSGIYDSTTHTCTMVSCHGRKTTPVWGNAAICQNCHQSNTGDNDKRILNQGFQNFSEVAPRIYSTQFADSGHGRTGTNYYGKDSYGVNNGNLPAGKTCTNCHKASVKHGTGGNPFRLYTINSATGNPNTLCEDCHGLNPGNSGKAQGTKALGIQTHASSVTQTGRYNFYIKCVDCHDPHGDNNILMLHSTMARPRITTGTRRELSDQYGKRLSNITGRNIDFVDNHYTSNYARKYQAARVCQVCHTQTKNPTTGTEGRFRWYSAGDKSHGSNKCTNCHSHSSGFKGAGCNGCHGFPPTDTFTLISLATGSKGKHSSGSVYAGAHGRHTSIFGGTPTTCSKCHYSGMWVNGLESGNIDLEFRAFQQTNPASNYTGASQKYYGQTAVQNGWYGYSGLGAGAADNTLRCDVKCHGAKGKWLTSSFDTNTAGPRWNNPASAKCGKCHGAKKAQGQGSWPMSNRHEKHAGTNSYGGYDFMCRTCHGITVLDTATTLNKNNHVNAAVYVKFTSDFNSRVDGFSKYSGGDTVVNSGFGMCRNVYCHSRGITTQRPYTSKATFPNYTAKWTLDPSTWLDVNSRCSVCHGNKVYHGITSAMPNYTSIAYGGPKENSHRKHVVDNALKCSYCHSATINLANNGIVDKSPSASRHVNRFRDITILSAFKIGQTNYSATVSSKKTCKNVRCHAGKTTPTWGSKISCQGCHLSTSGDTDDFTFNNFSGTAARIYSTEWTKTGHGKPRFSGDYAFSNNSGAGKTCTNCHQPAVKHGASNNYFRLLTSNPDRLCLSCHGSTPSGLGSFNVTISNVTGIQTHSWYNISTAGYVSSANGGNKKKATLYGGWNFGDGADQQKVKCVDCHDPHGDKNKYMVHTYPNFSGSDRVGRPAYNNVPYSISGGNQMTFSTVGGPQMNWSSYTKPINGPEGLGICQRCHSVMSNTTAMTNHNKGLYSNHQRTNRCTKCHKHKQGFKPSGCDGCHGYPPPAGPTSPNTWTEILGDSNTWGLHTPHAKNPRNRPGIIAENDVTAGAGFKCNRCHANTSDGSDPSMGAAGNTNAIMTQLTSVYGKWSPGVVGYSDVTDDTCSNIRCHTPRSFTRTWKKPSNCNGCHGYQNKPSGAFTEQTTASHKAHIHYTSVAGGKDYKKRKYGFRCTMCHVDNWPNYSTHYSGQVNMKFRFGLSTTAVYNRFGNQTTFKGWTTGGELATCSKVYCHGRFVNGTTITTPKWGNRFTGCSNCHKSKANAANMPGAHPLHVQTIGSGYEFPCSRCHVRTVVQNTISTLMWNYSSHVNGRKDIYFDTFNNNDGGAIDSARKCKNTYCHSSGYRPSPAGSFTTRTTLSNWTAYWYDNRTQKTGSRPCSYCHGNKIYNGITAAMPNQTSLWGNSHRTHAIRNSFRCQICHSATLNPNGTINYAGGNHVNAFKNVTIIATYKTGQTMYSSQVPATNKTCKNVRCHAGKTTPKWGTYIKCQNCHLSNTGDTDKRISANNTFQSFTAKSNPTAPRIYSTAWANTGHGRQSPYPSGNPAAARLCTDCHKASVPHGTSNNPFRLYTLNTVTKSPNTLCEDCHGVAPGQSVANKKGIQTHASSVTKTGRGHRFAMKCVDCHDPHGDNNIFMVHSSVARPSNSLSWKESSNTYGQLFVNATGRNVDFSNNNYSSDYAKKYKADKICQVCHSKTFKPNSSGVSRFRYYSAGDKTHGVSKCTSCHSHSQGFKGAACNSCHGFPPTGVQTILSGTLTSPKQHSSGGAAANIAGAHQTHVNVFGADSGTCSKCHSGGMPDSGTTDGNITIKFKAFTNYTGSSQKYQGQSAVRNGYYGYSGLGIASPGNNDQTCKVKCHGARGEWLTKIIGSSGAFGNPSSPKWNDANSVFCGSCHGAKRAAGQDSYPATYAHPKHAGWGAGQLNLMCRVCHGITVLGTATTLSDANHVNGAVYLKFTTEGRVDGSSAYINGDTVVNSGYGQCNNVYCHTNGTDRVAPYDAAGSAPNFGATWTTVRGSYKKANGLKARCNFCHGNQTWSGVTSAMPNYPDLSPKANKHPKHVKGYNFLCTSCHVNTTVNNTSIIDAATGNHVNRRYNINFSNNPGGRGIDNTMGFYTTTPNSSCKGIYCHSRGTKFSAPYTNTTSLANYTAHWGDNRGGYKTGAGNIARCNYCHGNRQFNGITAAMPNYADGSAKYNKHPKHVKTYGFACTVCHVKVTANSTSIDAVGGSDLHVDQKYNVNFNQNVPGRFANNTGLYYGASKCKNTYCHSRGTDFAAPYNTRTSLANFTAAWGDNRGSYSQAKGAKAKCNYCHGNKAFSGITAAMPNYSSEANKANKHPMHVRTYGFACNICHVKVAANNTAISDSSLHVNQKYNVNFNQNVPGRFANNTGLYYGASKCKNTYCHSRGTDFVPPYNTRTSLANFTAAWGDNRGSYSQAKGAKAKCNYCHGNKAFSGITAAMPNYSSEANKANKHPMHVRTYGFACNICHVKVAANNTAISNSSLHVNQKYNVNFNQNVPGRFANNTGLYYGASKCKNTYCHSRGTDFVPPYNTRTSLANFTAAWGDSRGGYKNGAGAKARCNYCHGNKSFNGITAAMPNYSSEANKANRHPMHVAKYGFACTVCHVKVTANSTSIDAVGGRNLHVNQKYNVNFNQNVPGRFATNTGLYYGASKCKNTYCHSRGTDFVAPYNTRTSLANFTAAWGDSRGGYKNGAGAKARCNYCHGNRLFNGITAAMPNYSSSTAKNNTHPLHVKTYGFTCTVCHAKVAANSTSISDSSLHVNQKYNINFNKSVPGRSFLNNTGDYTYISLSAKSRCRNTYCHSRGTDRVAPYITRTSLANFTAMWGDTRPGYSQAKGAKARCNYCHGSKAYSGITAAMPNYSTEVGKPNTHRKHVINLGYSCYRCHYGVARNNTSISDRASHVNGFYNISIEPGYSLGASLKRYSGVYNNSGGTCMNNTCHGSTGKPKWGQSNLPCQGCHLSATSGDLDQNGQFNGTAPRIYSGQWANQGHGRQTAYPSGNLAANKGCQAPNGCHKASVPHKTAGNPFRLFTLAKSDGNPNTLCLDCHGTGTLTNSYKATNAVGIMTHASSVTQTGRYNFAMKCVDCHDPHGDNNSYMLHSTLARPRTTTGRLRESSNQYGQLLTNITGRNVDFVQTLYTSDYARKFKADKPCQVCHTQTKNPSTLASRFRYYSAMDKSHGTGKCTASCHKHTAGFKGAGESSGNESCDGCHGSNDLFEKMRSTSGYHHVMSNTSADNTNNSKYPNVTAFGPNDQKSSRRRCLMCHVDHNVFRPDLNNDGTGGRARNLRWSVLAQGNNTGINTDFWPAKRKNVKGRLGSDANTGNYSSTYPIYGPSQYNGVCISCHKNVQYKNTTLANQFNVQRARNFQVSLYTSSSHNFQVISSTFVFGSGGQRSKFRGNCTKCHRTSKDYSDLSKSSAQQGYGKWPVALHDKNVPSLMMNIATSSFKPKIEQLCYNCHDNLARASNGPGSMDFYSSIRMNSGAKMIKTAVTGKRYVKPIESDEMAGRHKIDEYYKADASVAENGYPSVQWNFSTGAPGGVGRHVECVDCHNTHGGNATIRRVVGAPFRGNLNTGDGWKNYTVSTGNKIAGAQKGVWGVSLSYTFPDVTKRGQTPQFTKVVQVTYQYEICLKCHSRYAYGASVPPGVPDGLPDPTGTTAVPFDNLAPDVPQADISRMINPNNYGYHPIFKKGRNQPAKTWNSNWPSAKSNWMYKDRFNNKTAFISVSGLSWNFVPPFSQHSLLACTDCHVADNSGKVVQRFKPNGTPATGGTWTGASDSANIEKDGDGLVAVATVGGSATLAVDVSNGGNVPSTTSETMSAVAYGKTTATTKSAKTQTLTCCSSGGTACTTNVGTGTVSFGSAIGRTELSCSTFVGGTAWTTIEANYAAKITTNAATNPVTLDYIGLEVMNSTTADVRGPHGSMQRWILTDLDTEIWFDADNNNTLSYNGTDRPNSAALGYSGDERIFCWNCHRRDVYGYNPTPVNKLYSRFDHTSATNEPWDGSVKNQWGITCMNCHAGGGVGEIHGSFANSTTTVEFYGSKVDLGRPRGVRLLNGAAFNFKPSGSSCYTEGVTGGTPYSSQCGTSAPQHAGNVALTTNYSYTSW